MNLENKRILITGGAGFIGSNLSLTLQEKYPNNDYFIIDNFSSGHYRNILKFRGDVITADISEIDLGKHFPQGVDLIFHQAAITDTTVSDQKMMMKTNVEGFRNILNFAIKHQANLIYASSASVYGHSSPPMQIGKNEEPANVYGYSKLMNDRIAQKYYSETTIIGLRYFNVYGPGESFKGKMASMIWQLYLQMKENKKPQIFKFGEQKRDQVYIKDIVQANILASQAEKSGIFNVGTGKATTFNEIISALNQILGKELKTDYVDNPFEHFQDFTQADLSLTQEKLGYEPQYDIQKGISDYFKK